MVPCMMMDSSSEGEDGSFFFTAAAVGGWLEFAHKKESRKHWNQALLSLKMLGHILQNWLHQTLNGFHVGAKQKQASLKTMFQNEVFKISCHSKMTATSRWASYQSQQVIRALCTYMDFILSMTMEFDPKIGTAVKLNRKGLWSGVEGRRGGVGGEIVAEAGQNCPSNEGYIFHRHQRTTSTNSESAACTHGI